MIRNGPLLALLCLCACSQPFEGTIVDRLANAGLPRPLAECMAERWVDRLSPLQLREIANAADDLKAKGGEIGIGEMIARVRQIQDPEIVQVVSRSAMVCALTA